MFVRVSDILKALIKRKYTKKSKLKLNINQLKRAQLNKTLKEMIFCRWCRLKF